jgi:hypothetical protein
MANQGNLSGVARPGARLARTLKQMGVGNASVEDLLDLSVGVEALAGVLTQGIEACLTKDGRLDTKDLAAFVLRRMKEHQR